MAGVKGRSGGKRLGAGRKRAKAAAPAAPPPPIDGLMTSVPEDPLEFLKSVMTGKTQATTIQVRAAIAAVQYVHTKRGDGGKKDEQVEKAAKAASKFKAGAAPLKLVGTKG